MASSERGCDNRAMGTHPAFLGAAGAGLLHGAASVYWGLGWAIITVGAVKIAFALSPLLVDGRWWRIFHWLGAVVLVLWGGANTVVINLVLSGVLPRGENYDHAAMTGHGWRWDC